LDERVKFKKRASSDYLSNKQMYEELIRCQLAGKISDKLGKMFLLLSKHYATKPNFSGYTYKDEMISSGVLACCVAFTKFDGNKSNNPFAYFTQCIHHSFLQVLNKERANQDIRDKLLIQAELNPSSGFCDRERERSSHEEDSDVE
jgi:DNA-directed RNA polymerase specialized sigma subunit